MSSLFRVRIHRILPLPLRFNFLRSLVVFTYRLQSQSIAMKKRPSFFFPTYSLSQVALLIIVVVAIGWLMRVCSLFSFQFYLEKSRCNRTYVRNGLYMDMPNELSKYNPFYSSFLLLIYTHFYFKKQKVYIKTKRATGTDFLKSQGKLQDSTKFKYNINFFYHSIL